VIVQYVFLGGKPQISNDLVVEWVDRYVVVFLAQVTVNRHLLLIQTKENLYNNS
jgi:hypothetical protein